MCTIYLMVQQEWKAVSTSSEHMYKHYKPCQLIPNMLSDGMRGG